MYDVRLETTTKDARKSKEITETDLGMDPDHQEAEDSQRNGSIPHHTGAMNKIRAPPETEADQLRKKTASPLPLDAAQMSESGYGSTDDLDSSRSNYVARGPVYSRVVSIPSPTASIIPSKAAPERMGEEVDSSLTTVLGAVVQTKIITTVFEVSNSGMGVLQSDFTAELERWFRSQGFLVVASELVWSVPAKHRRPAHEVAVKEALFAALRRNNKRVLDLRWPSRRWCSPIALPEAGTEEVSGKERGLNAYQGTYRRHYDALLPLQHGPTAPTHADYWEFTRSVTRPSPQRFLFGPRRSLEEFTYTTLLALNAVALTFR